MISVWLTGDKRLYKIPHCIKNIENYNENSFLICEKHKHVELCVCAQSLSPFQL